ncbi:MAG: hypothetical protein HQL26_09680 [Candidatus Omnitrophica bacterium]|nr:hypothetical protein [Candidatus Omnitrophota bacterium]
MMSKKAIKPGITFTLTFEEYWLLFKAATSDTGVVLALCKAGDDGDGRKVHFAFEDFAPCLKALSVATKRTTSVKKRDMLSALSRKLAGYAALRGQVRVHGRAVVQKPT